MEKFEAKVIKVNDVKCTCGKMAEFSRLIFNGAKLKKVYKCQCGKEIIDERSKV